MKLVVQRISRLPLAVWCAVFFGAVAGILTIAAPIWQLEHGVHALRLDLISPAAAPPLGHKARLTLALLASGLVGLVILVPYAVLRLVKPRQIVRPFNSKPIIVAGEVRRADAQVDEPDTISRRPIFADRELGAPLMSEGALARASVFDPLNNAPHSDLQLSSTPDWSEAEAAPMTEPPSAPLDLPAAAVRPSAPEASTNLAMMLPLSEMIARLERGLSNRTPGPIPPSPHTSAPLPSAPRMEPMPVVTPLSVVPRSAPIDDPERGRSDDLLQEAMNKLSALAGHQR